MPCSIGEFHKVYYQPILMKYAYHRMLLCLIGKHGCKNLRDKVVLADMNAMMTQRNYTESLKTEFYMEIQSKAF